MRSLQKWSGLPRSRWKGVSASPANLLASKRVDTVASERRVQRTIEQGRRSQRSRHAAFNSSTSSPNRRRRQPARNSWAVPKPRRLGGGGRERDARKPRRADAKNGGDERRRSLSAWGLKDLVLTAVARELTPSTESSRTPPERRRIRISSYEANYAGPPAS